MFTDQSTSHLEPIILSAHPKSIFRVTLHFQIIPASLLATRLSVRNLYRDLVVNCFLLSRAQLTESMLSGFLAKTLLDPATHIVRDLLNSMSHSSSSQHSATEQLGFLTSLKIFSKATHKGTSLAQQSCQNLQFLLLLT